MKKILFTLLIITTIIACSDNDATQNEYNYTFTDQSSLTITSLEDSYMKYGSVESGENLVFEYNYIFDDNEQIADDEYSETIRFELNPELDNFNYTNEELLDINLVLSKYCYCYFPLDETKNITPIGTISGEKTSENTWLIKFDLTFYGDETRTIEETFELK